MIWHRIGVLRSLFQARSPAPPGARRRGAGRAAVPEIAEGPIPLGGVMTLQPVRIEAGLPEVAPIDPLRLAYEAGRRDLALQLLALMRLGVPELNSLSEDDA
ncbi:MAG TPA: hypothetical protein PKC84_00345 [Paracoccaceae bacterium]|nr:hypothetical protein [Paracoccaceae bacterium]